MSTINEDVRAALIWWVGAEIARRHYDLQLMHADDDGPANTPLSIIDKKSQRPLAYLSEDVPNRAVVVGSPVAQWAMTWDQLLNIPGGLAVQKIERQMGLYVPSRALKTLPETLVYRVIAQILAMTMTSSVSWRAYSCSIFDVADSQVMPIMGSLDPFPSAVDLQRSQIGTLEREVVEADSLTLSMDTEEVALFHAKGYLHLRNNEPPICLVDLYQKLDRNINALAVKVLNAIKATLLGSQQ